MNTLTNEFEIIIGGNANGTFLNGSMDASYKDVVKVLGKPQGNDGYKTDANWVCTINGKTITVYNYKDGKNYCGKQGIATTKLRDWHIGGAGNIREEATFLAKKIGGTLRLES